MELKDRVIVLRFVRKQGLDEIANVNDHAVAEEEELRVALDPEPFWLNKLDAETSMRKEVSPVAKVHSVILVMARVRILPDRHKLWENDVGHQMNSLNHLHGIESRMFSPSLQRCLVVSSRRFSLVREDS
jgi:hypothetical protein